MRNKEFSKLNKSELLEVIYRLQLRERELTEQVEDLQLQASQRYEKLERSGNIAEAALAIHDVFSCAQQAADDYVSTVSARAAEKEQQALRLLRQSQEIAGAIHAFLGELNGDEMGLDSYRRRIEAILQELNTALPTDCATGDKV